jgi:UDP:flavonoid glycosyltransferase YjiC (YdhE family)
MLNIIMTPYPQLGHTIPTIKISKELISRGHKVCYLGLVDYQEYVSSQGLDYIPVFEKLCPKGFIHEQADMKVEHNFALVDKARRLSSALNFRMANEIFEEIARVVERIKPDLFLVDTLLPDMAVVAHKLGVACILQNVMLYYSNWEELDPFYKPLESMPELVVCPEEFEFPDVARRGGRESNRYYSQASIDFERQEAAFAWEKLDDSKPLIYCALGTQSQLSEQTTNLLQVVIDAMAIRQDYQAVIVLNKYSKIEDFHSVPSNVVLTSFAPQLQMLKRASLMINHGGLNSLKECIYMGVPSIAFPYMIEQAGNAARAAFHGLAIRGNVRTVTVEKMLSYIKRIEEDLDNRTRIQKMAARFKELEESQVAVQVIERLFTQLRLERNGAAVLPG